MKKNVLYFAILLMAINSLSFAQSNIDFFVVHVKGKIIRKLDNQKWQTVKSNDLLKSNDRISIGEKSFINLYESKTKQYYVVHGVRSFTLNDLISNKIDSENKPINNFLIKAFENLANAFNGFADSRSISAIFRSVQSDQEIIAIMPKNTKVFGDSILFEWIAKDISSTIELTLLDENINQVFDTLIQGKSSCLIKRIIKPGKEYVWQLSTKNSKKNMINYFSTVNADELLLFNNRIDSLDNFYSSIDTPNYYVLKGLLSEDMGFRSTAYNSFKKAFSLADNNEKYGKIIEDFFSRQKLNLKYKDVLSYK